MNHRRRRDAIWLLLVLICCGVYWAAVDASPPGPPIRSPWNLHVAYFPGYGPQVGWRAELHDDGSGFLEQDPCPTPAPDAVKKRSDFRLSPESLKQLKEVFEQQHFASLGAEYRANVSDMPSRFLELRSPGLDKAVTAEESCEDPDTEKFRLIWGRVVQALPAVPNS